MISIYFRLIGSRIRSQLQYRISFVFGFLGNMLMTLLDLVAILLFFAHVGAIGGWSFQEIAFLYGSSTIGLRFADAAIGHIELLPHYIRTGMFDSFLMRPMGSLFQLVTADFTLRQLGGLLQGAAVFGYAVANLGVDWTLPKILMTVLMLAAGFLIFIAIWIAGNSISFWFIDTREMANAFTYGGNFVTQFPMHIFSGWMRRLFTVVIPVSFINYFPSLYVLDKVDPHGWPGSLRFMSPGVAALFLGIAGLVWRLGVRRYTSTGS